MKKLFTFVLAAFAFAACTQNEVEELTANRVDAPETLTVGFEGGDTRIELNEALKTVWTEGDEVSVYFYSDANQKWQYQGETGERLGTLRRVDAGVATTQTDYVVVAYPYNTSYTLNRINANLIASLPAVQSYKEGSYGAEGNIMVAQSEFTQFSLKSVCGWLRVELTGEGEVVESVKVCGNNGEQVAGLIYVDTATAEAILASEMGEASDEEQVGGVGGGLEFDNTVFTDVTLDCGNGVELGAEATEFYVALLPQTFEKGMTVEVDYSNGNSQTLVCENSITIIRNHISPIESEANVEVEIPTNQLWYTATALVKSNSSAFNVAIVSNEWDEATGEGVITFDGELTTIGDYAFSWYDSLTSVSIPDSVTTIGDYAFCYCSSLTSVTIPDSVTTIGEAAFARCGSLAEFKGKFAADGGRCLIIDGVLNAFALGCGVTEYTIPDSVTTIGANAFESCSSLTSVTIPDSVTTIGIYAFYECSSLTSVTIPDSVTSIGDYAFSGCESLTSVTIGNSVTTIGDLAFYNCSSLTSVYCKATTPPTLGDNVFWGYDNNWNYVMLACDIYVPAESVETYKAAAYWSEYADYIIGYNFETGEVVAINNKLFYTATALVEPYKSSAFNVAIVSNEWNEATGEGVITFDGELTEIGYMAFRSCDSLTSVTIPDSVTTIGGCAFMYCYSLTSVTIPDSVKTIGNGAFYECYSLTSVTIPDSVKTIGNGAFYECDSLTSVTIPDSVTTIGDEAFHLCDSLTSVTIPDSVTTIGEAAFGGCSELAEFKGKFAADGGRCLIKDNAIIAYAEASGTTYTIPDSVTTIGRRVFESCYSLTSVTIPDSVTTIGDYAFRFCDSLTSVTIPDSVTTIGEEVFYDCDSIAEFKGKFAADGGRCLIIDGVLNAFALGCGVTEYTIPDSVTTIGDFAFYDCRSLESVTIPDSVTTIGGWAFCGCDSLTSVYCKATTPPTLDGYGFYGNADGRKIYVPAESVEAYKAAEGWSEYAADIVGYDFE